MTDVYEQIAKNKRRSIGYAVLFVVIWVGVGALGGLLAGVFSGEQQRSDGGTAMVQTSTGGMVVALVVAIGGIVFAVTSGARMVLRTSDARPADGPEFRQLRSLVEALAIGEGLPAPAVYVIDDPSPNAFATGISPDKASITVTTGLLELLNHSELEGVLAHELSHIKNYDVRLLLIITTLIGLASLLAGMIWRSMYFLRGGRGKNGAQVALVLMAFGILLSLIGFVFGPLVRMALSRRRESLADASAVQLTRNPAGLIRALRKLEANDKPFKKFSQATAAMCIDDPTQRGGWVHNLYNSHPPIGERIAALEAIAGRSYELPGTAAPAYDFPGSDGMLGGGNPQIGPAQ